MPVALSQCRDYYEREARRLGYVYVAGTDEVGRGCLFGPVYAAAVILDPSRHIRGLRDSKQLAPERRDELAAIIRERAIAWSVASLEAGEIDRLNIYHASLEAMKQAVAGLSPAADFVLVDGFPLRNTDLPQRAITKGDVKCRTIAAASILAKTARDARLCEWDTVYPQYGLAKHKGYPTPEHVEALARYGVTPEHRQTFGPVRRAADACR